MRQRISPGVVIGAVAVAVFVVFSLSFGFTVVSVEEEAALNVEFDPAAYVEDNWEAIETSIQDNAVPLADVLNRIQPGDGGRVATSELRPVAEELGLITTGDAHVYRISATGTVTDVDTETSRGTIGLDIDGYDGPIDVRVYLGSRIPSDESSVRDAAGFIEFGSFRDQMQYGRVASIINQEVAESLEAVREEITEGQQVSIVGAMTMRTFNQPTIDVSQLMVVPVEVQPS